MSTVMLSVEVDLHVEQSRRRLEPHRGLPRRTVHQPADTARAVATRGRERAVGVIDAYECFRAPRLRIVQDHHLVEVRPLSSGDRRRLLGRENLRRSAQVDNDDLVAETIHFHEGDASGCVHAALYGSELRKDN